MPSIASAAGVAGGYYHTVLTDGSGNVWTWGQNGNGQLGNGTTVSSTLPIQVSGLTGVVQVAAGTYHTLALKQDGTVWAWGLNSNGQLGDGTTTQRNAPVQVTGLSGVSQIAAGDTHSVAWKVDGSVWTWGNNGNGQLGDGTTTSRSNAAQVPGLSGVLRVGAGGSHTLAAKIDGTAWSWGMNSNGQLGDGTTTQRNSPVQVVGLSGITGVAGGTLYSVALKSDGTAWSWGSNLYGQLGDGTTVQRALAVRVANVTGLTSISAGQYHVLAVRNDGTAWSWGADFFGELGDGEITPSLAPTRASSLSGVIAVGAARYETSTLILGDGTIWAGGYNLYGEVGDGTTLNRLTFVKVTEAGYAWKTGTPVPSVLTGTYAANQTVSVSCATAGATIRYTTDGSDPVTTSSTYSAPLSITSSTTLKAKAWSSLAPSNIQTSIYTMKVAVPTFSPVAGNYTSAQNVTLSTTTSGATIRYTTDGSTPTSTSTAYSAPIPVATTTTLKAAGFKTGWTSSDVASAAYAMNFGTLAAPGMSPGAGTSVGSATVTLSGPSGATIRYTTNGTDPTATSTIYTTPVVLTATTTLKAKAFKVDWTLSPTTTNVYTIQVATPSISLASGQYPAGQTVNLTCSTPGASIYYSLDGSDPTQTYPFVASGGAILVGNYTLKAKAWATGLDPSATTGPVTYTITGVAGGMVAAGTSHSLVLKTDGTVWAWGNNGWGQNGDGTTTPRSTPVAVSGLTGVVTIAAGANHSLAVTSSGAVWAWGNNTNGQLGDGTTTQRSSPVQVSTLSNVVAVAAGLSHSLALKTDGTIWAWGYNSSGQLGDASNTQRTAPVQVATLTGVTVIAAGANHSLARKSDGTLWSWGANGSGQLGDNTTTPRNSPIQVTAVTGVVAAAGGTYDSLVARTDGFAWSWGTYSGTSAPAAKSGITGATAVKVGASHFMALESNWYVWTWGQNGAGQLGNGTNSASTPPVWVSGLPHIVSISAGDGHSLALGQDGTVWAWGSNGSYQLGDGTSVNRNLPVKIADAGFAWKTSTPVFSPAPGTFYSSTNVSISTSATGSTIYYTTDGSTPTTSSPVYSGPISVTTTRTVKAKTVKAGFADSNVTAGDYTLTLPGPGLSPVGGNFAAAQNVVVSCSIAGATIRYTTNGVDPTTSDPTVVSGGTVVVNKTLTLKAKAWLTGWTASAVAAGSFTLKVPTPSFSPGGGTFTTAPTVTISDATAGAVIHYTTNGLEPTEMDSVVASGGTVNLGMSATLRAKAFIAGWAPSDSVSANYLLNLAAAATPTLTPAPGTYTAAQTVTLSTSTAGALVRYTLDGADPTPWSPVFAGPFSVAGTTTVKAIAYAPDRTPSGIASGTYQINLGAVETPTLNVPSGSYVTSRTVTVSCATTGATIRYTTNGSDPTVSDPTIASGGTLLVDRALIVKAAAWKTGMPQSAVARRDYVVTGMVAAAGWTTLALKSDGTGWAWGWNQNGQLGDGTTTNRTSPVQVSGLTGAIQIAEGVSHSLALKSDGTVWAWGNNANGQLGDGTTTSPRLTPVQVTGLTNVIAIAAGQYHSLAVKSDGSVWAWGSNGYGQLGDGTTTQRNAPVQITGVTGVVAIAAGQDHSLAAKSDGSVWAWGYNTAGQLGDGTTATQRLTPVAVVNLSGVSRVAAGVSFSVALRASGQSSGTVWSWGLNAVGQLGDGTALNKNAPGEAASGVMAIAVGDRHVVAPFVDGRTMAWGANDNSQLGNAGSTARPFALPAAGVNEILQVAAGLSYSVGVRADGSVWGWGANGAGQLGLGSQASQTQTIAASIPGLSLASNGWMMQDTDQDGLTNAAEYRLGSDPLNPDTNQDGLKDGVDVAMGKSATSPDVDGDGLLNSKELQIGTNPLIADTDGDGVLDGADCAPLDPTRWQCTNNPSDTTPPVITLAEPPNAVPLP